MKFQDSSFYGSDVTESTKNVTHGRADDQAKRHLPKGICFFSKLGHYYYSI